MRVFDAVWFLVQFPVHTKYNRNLYLKHQKSLVSDDIVSKTQSSNADNAIKFSAPNLYKTKLKLTRRQPCCLSGSEDIQISPIGVLNSAPISSLN